MIYQISDGIYPEIICLVAKVRQAVEQRIIVPSSMRCCGYYAQVPHGVIYRLMMVIGKIPTGVSAAVETGAHGKIFLIW